MKFCPNCGTKIPEGITFCQACGLPVTSASSAEAAMRAFTGDSYNAAAPPAAEPAYAPPHAPAPGAVQAGPTSPAVGSAYAPPHTSAPGAAQAGQTPPVVEPTYAPPHAPAPGAVQAGPTSPAVVSAYAPPHTSAPGAVQSGQASPAAEPAYAPPHAPAPGAAQAGPTSPAAEPAYAPTHAPAPGTVQAGPTPPGAVPAGQKPGKPLKLRKIFRRQQATLAILKNTGLFFSIFCFLMNVVMALLFFDVFDPFMDMFFWNSASPLQGLIPRPLYRAAKNFIDNDNLWPFFLVCLAGLLLYIVSQILYLLRYRKFRREWKARHMSPQQTSR